MACHMFGAIIWTNADILSIRHQETYFNDISFAILKFSFNKMYQQDFDHVVSASMC